MTRKPAFWIAFAVLAILSVLAAERHFAAAFPLVSIDLRMDRAGALRAARDVAVRDRLGPAGFRQAATFGGDDEVQTYVELEGGGKEVFGRMIRDGRYAPYTWRVRHFRERDPNETWIRFTPAGVAYGFVERLPETAPGARLAASEARAIAERGAVAWQVPLAAYALVEQAQEDKPGHRIDHTLVYERTDRIGEGRLRVRLVVAGDRLVEITPFVRVPEAFTRRYQRMRSANEAIGFAAGVAVLVLYGLGGIVIGLFVLLRQRWVLWRPALAWGIGVAALQLLATINEWPLAWLQYDTALSTATFLAQQTTSLVAGAVAMTVMFTLSFMAAESLSRRAFPHHPQLWRTWSREAGASRGVLGRTVAGYLLVGFFFAYEVALYLVASRWLGWWTPSDALVHPDVLATYLPWLSALAPSVQAGFWEESLFRAVPLAGAALIGDRLGHRRAAIAIAMIVQALVFGAGHAPYPNQPAYARPVELILPSLLFGAVYLRFGLLPGIVLHVAFDIVWFALPLFVSRAPGILIDRALVVVLALVPLWILLWRRWQVGGWLELPRALSNGAWRPSERVEHAAMARRAGPASGAPSIRVVRGTLAVGAAGLVVSAAVAWSLARDVPRLPVTRAAALQSAAAAVAERGGRLDGTWRTLAATDAEPGEAHAFVRSTAGGEAYRRLLGTYLPPPRWRVRFARFEGDLAARAEEWSVAVDGRGEAVRVRHTLPESAPGAALPEDAARQLAAATVAARYGLDPGHLRAVAAAPSKLPARTDWLVTFEDRSGPALPQGERRVSVAIAGREVTDVWRFVHVPEEWQRAERERRTAAGVFGAAGTALLGGLLLGFAAVTIVAWSRGTAHVRGALGLFLVLAGVRALAFANEWPARLTGFSTAQPFALQATELAVALLVGAAVVAAIAAIAAGDVRLSPGPLTRAEAARMGLGAGGAAGAVLAIAALVRAGSAPVWPPLTGAATALPCAALPLGALFGFVLRTIVVALVFTAVDRLSDGWSVHRARGTALLLATGVLVGAGAPGPDLLRWAAAGLLVGVLLVAAYALVFRWSLAPLPLTIGVATVVGALADAIARPYPGAGAGGVIAALLVSGAAWWWFNRVTMSGPVRSGSIP